MSSFLKLFGFIYLPVSTVILISCLFIDYQMFITVLIPWGVVTFSGLQNSITTIFTLEKNFSVFYGVYIGGVIFRLILIGVVTFIVLKFSNLLIYYYLISVAFFYIFMQVLEAYFLSKAVKQKNLEPRG